MFRLQVYCAETTHWSSGGASSDPGSSLHLRQRSVPTDDTDAQQGKVKRMPYPTVFS
jgi:hypothetical protein